MVDLPSAAARIAVNFPDMALLPVTEADREAQVEAMTKRLNWMSVMDTTAVRLLDTVRSGRASGTTDMVQLNHKHHKSAYILHRSGCKSTERCDKCTETKSRYEVCIVSPSFRGRALCHGACSNCVARGRGNDCSIRRAFAKASGQNFDPGNIGDIISFGGFVRASFSEAEKLKKSEAVVFYESDDEKMTAKNGGESVKEEPDAIESVISTPSGKATASSASPSEVLDAVNRVGDRLLHNTDAVNQLLQRSAKLAASIGFLSSNLKVPVTASPRPTGRQPALVTDTSSNLGSFPASGSLKFRHSKFLSGLPRSRTIDDLDEDIVVAEKPASKKQKNTEHSPCLHAYISFKAEGQQFILKYIHPVNFEDFEEVNNRLRGNASHVRLAVDTIPDKSMFVFEHFTGHLLALAQKDLPLVVIKRILKNALTGLAELHDQDIVHIDVKANNVINWRNRNDEIIVAQVQLGDLEDAVHIPPGCDMVGKQAGNWMWRSPEAHARGPVNKPSDVFSFALVCICAVYKRIIFAVREDELEEGVDPLAVVIERQISYFADEDGLNGFLKHLGDNPWVRVFEVTRDGFNQETPREPFAFWNGVDDDFKSLICSMTRFDPGRRITACQALEHKWFEGV
ncbi:hypothetical protein ANOM_004084 [Aspergillus nomiae NRRL 13137]|uniref:Protein kinase domain-containing protein n=1 Tax=Aspergillus nomiae NRRL (strain ATCC 15546 / NRRL 13137 / CBS 260.88 / M93) TaxID=1509407 RepID=A0A0L1J9F0_ASPN3|nr:uncharacterized protein ANOM_004084 [Aspergillus nomiae NRRL 13137]KNG88038.1 hypothetical protein ANOM_004084 [Aspergillus nomiae NRRL 13137]